MRLSNKPQKGAALITALLVLALVAAASVLLEVSQSMNIQRSKSFINTDQAYLYSQGVQQWAIYQLGSSVSLENNKIQVKQAQLKLKPVKINSAILSGRIDDLQARFNLNKLRNPKALPQFIRLLQILDPKIKPEKAKQLALAIQDWISLPSGKEQLPIDFSNYYAKAKPGYKAPHRPMQDPSELRLVYGVNSKLYRQLRPYIATLPENTPYNINSISAPVLASIAGIELPHAKQLIQARKRQKWRNLEDFLLLAKRVDKNEISLYSEFYGISSQIELNGLKLGFYSKIQRKIITKSNEKSVKIEVLWNSRETI